MIESPDVLEVTTTGLPKRARQVIQGHHLVLTDGTISLEGYGDVPVAGLTVSQAREALARHLAPFARKLKVDVRIEVQPYSRGGYDEAGPSKR